LPSPPLGSADALDGAPRILRHDPYSKGGDLSASMSAEILPKRGIARDDEPVFIGVDFPDSLDLRLIYAYARDHGRRAGETDQAPAAVVPRPFRKARRK